ncbi:hypothetical protein [Pseudoalteromonas sp. S16_S37]|uniref:hypothetical protein n=1 Tax=Pseudoalteromonas sp. S16_S37 TaxID=2720228 RepID=UPI00168159D1|nr:hypothetical protein [Pseudoalteromonas sp. S16_S37]MBD1583502.1 hypothetical protein [Pseudoalteromonas sp. S16_S37]
MSTLASLNIMLGANSAVLRKELVRAKKATSSFVSSATKKLNALSKSTLTMGKRMGGGLAIGTASLGAGLYAMERTLKSIEDIRRQAANVSLPIEQYQAYAFATQAAGLQSEQFGDVVKDLNAKITDFAVSGGGALADFFAVTGESIDEWQQLQPAEQFERFVSEINKMSESQARFWLDEINDSASQMFSTLVGSNGEFKQNVELAKQLGLVMNKDTVAGVQQTYKEVNILKAMLGGTWQHLVASAAPAIKFVTTGLRSWLTDTANASGGFANLGKSLSTSILSAVHTSIKSLSQLFYQIQSASYKFTGEHNGAYLIMQRNLRKLNTEYTAQERIVNSLRDEYQSAQKAVELHQRGATTLSSTQLKHAKNVIAQYDEQLFTLGRIGNQTTFLEQQLSDFEQQEGISAPFKSALSTIQQLKTEINNVKTTSTFDTPKAPALPAFKPQTVVKNPFASQIKQAQEYYEVKRLMREQDWNQEKAQLQLKLNEYALANDSRLITDDQYRLLASQATDLYNQQQLTKNQSFLEQLKSQVRQTNTDYQSMWGNTFDRFTQGVGQSVANAVMVQQSFSDSMKSILRSVLHSTIAALAEMGAKRMALWAVEKLLNKATATGAATLLTTQAQAMALMAGLNAFSSTAAIPIVGPFAAPAAMGAALAISQPMAAAITGISAGMVGMAHSGIDYVPKEGTWLLDKGERVYKQESAEKIDRMSAALVSLSQQQTQSKSPTNINVSFKVDATDVNGFQAWFDANKTQVIRLVQDNLDAPI